MEPTKTVQRLQDAILIQDDELAEKLVQRLTSADEEALITMTETDHNDFKWWSIRSLAVVGSEDCLPTVTQNLHSSDSAIRAACALAIANLYQRFPDTVKTTMPQLAELLTDDDGLVRQAAANALSMCGNDAVDALAAIIDSLHDGARARAAYALQKIASKEAAQVLYPLLDDPNHLVRSYAWDGVDAAGVLDELVVNA